MRTSETGIALIKRNEGCVLRAYLDRIADPPVWTIGYGDTLNVSPDMQITKQEAEDRLAARLAREFEPGVLEALQGSPVSQSQFDAMVSLAWNIGVGAFRQSSVARRHRAGDYAGAADAFLWWNKAGGEVVRGLQRRRAEERALYLSGAASPSNESPIARSEPPPAPTAPTPPPDPAPRRNPVLAALGRLFSFLRPRNG